MTTSPSEQRPDQDATFDVVVVGAGPAGLAAAAAAADHGARVAVVDAGTTPGGQFWRRPADAGRARQLAHLHHDLAGRQRLLDRIGRGTATWLAGHRVWAVERAPEAADGFVLHTVADEPDGSEREHAVRGRRLVLAPGAYDRQVPFPGWTLPGVFTAGGVQALLKGHGVLAGRRVVVAGTGPFLLPVATGLASAGAAVVGVHEAARGRAWLSHADRLRAVVRSPAKLGEALGYAGTLARHRIPVRTGSVLVAAEGGAEGLESVTVARADPRGGVVAGSERRIRCDTLAVGWGFTPQLELPAALGCATRVDLDGSTVCVVDDTQAGSVPGVWVAGEACGVGGAALAVVEGEIAGRAAAGVPADRVDVRLRRRRTALRAFAAAMHGAHPVPAGWDDRLAPDTVVCRCEEVTAARLRSVVTDDGATDARSAKLLARPGMGWCQGRVCGYATACLTARWSGAAAVPAGSARPVAAPLRLGTLAAGADDDG